jgi:hypothetical protein
MSVRSSCLGLAVALLGACGDGAMMTASVDAAPPRPDADEGTVRVTRERLEDRLGGDLTPVASPWGPEPLALYSLADPANRRLPARHDGATAVFEGVPRGPYVLLREYLPRRVGALFGDDERTVTITQLELVSQGSWPSDVAELRATVTGAESGLLWVASTGGLDPAEMYCEEPTGATTTCTAFPPLAAPWGDGAQIIVIDAAADPLRYLLADGSYDVASRRVLVSGALVSEPRQTWRYDAPVAQLAAAAVADEPRCAGAVAGNVSLYLYPRVGRARIDGLFFSTSSVAVDAASDVAGTRQAVVPPGFDTVEGAFIRFGACRLSYIRRPDGSPVIAELGVARNLRVNGARVEGDNVQGAGLVPTVSWDPPARGIASGYRIEIGGASGTRVELPAEVRSFKVPPGWLSPAGMLIEVIALAGAHDHRSFYDSPLPSTQWAVRTFVLP